MEQFAKSPTIRAAHAAKARTRAALYTWDRAAGIILKALELAARD